MSTFWQIFQSIGTFAGFAFIAGLLLSLPSLFSRTALRRQRRMPLPDVEAPEPAPPQISDSTGWRHILGRIIAFPFGVLLSIVVFPALLAMALVATCASYRFFQHLAYRTLRRHRSVFAFPLSFVVGIRVFIARVRQPHAPPHPGIA